jgi:anaphase-promoting complex subunit 11
MDKKYNIFEFESMNIMSSWYFNTPKNDECWICHRNLNTNSLKNKGIGKHSIVVKGNCGHCFHEECISTWTKKYNKRCVICNEIWKECIDIESSTFTNTQTQT